MIVALIVVTVLYVLSLLFWALIHMSLMLARPKGNAPPSAYLWQGVFWWVIDKYPWWASALSLVAWLQYDDWPALLVTTMIVLVGVSAGWFVLPPLREMWRIRRRQKAWQRAGYVPWRAIPDCLAIGGRAPCAGCGAVGGGAVSIRAQCRLLPPVRRTPGDGEVRR